jgi:voltage-gated potassium channel
VRHSGAVDLRAWERRTDLPLAGLALAFLAAYAWPILDPNLAPALDVLCSWVTWVVWAMFVADYLVSVSLADDRRSYLTHHLLDLVVIALPVLRPLRLLRLVTLFNVLNRGAAASLRGKVAVYVTGGASLTVFIAALAVLDAERGNPDANITTFPDALWWAMTTVTTVGYGDQYPITTAGRLVAVGLMVAGIALLGTVTATLASWLVEHIRATERETQSDLVQLTAEVQALREQIRLMSSPENPAVEAST